MKKIPNTKFAPVLRSDFSDENIWKLICFEMQKPVQISFYTIPFQANVEFLSDPAFDNISVDQILSFVQQPLIHYFIFVVDHVTITNRDHPILVVDLFDEPGRTFRIIPSETWGVENNLSIANMSFDEFADHVDPDGIFRGFPMS